MACCTVDLICLPPAGITPETAFTLPGEFFKEHSVGDGPLFGFHRMNAFTGMTPLDSFHFHDIEKNADVTRDMRHYRQHLEEVFEMEPIAEAVM